MTLATLVLLAVLQSGGDPHHPGGQAAPQADNPQRELVERIRKTLRRIDEALLDTSEAEPEDVADALGDLRSKQEQVIRDLEELIKQAKYQQSNSSSSSSSSNSDSSSGSSSQQPQPKPRESDGSKAPDPRDGDAPKPQDGQGQQDEQQQQQQQQGEGKPEDQQASAGDEGENRPSGSIPPDPIEPFTRTDVDGRWGLLPPKLQERLTNLHVDDVPERYRTWLEAYIRAMHDLERSGSGR